MKKNPGSTLGLVLMVIVVMVMFSTTLVNLLRDENHMGLQHRRSTRAFHLAEAAVDKAVWKLRESRDVWDSVADGSIDSDYTGGKVFSDIEGGTYKITISTTDDEDERMIIGVGRDETNNEMRAIEIIMECISIESAIFAPSLDCQGGVIVHWGGMESEGDMILNGGAANRYYPRKYAVGMIDPRDTDPGGLNTDSVEYWAYYPVPARQGIAFEVYRSSANDYGEYYSGNKEFKGNKGYDFDHDTDPDVMYFVEGDCTLNSCYMKGTLIIMGDLTLSGNGKETFDAVVPADAWKEYQKGTEKEPSPQPDTVDTDEYPGDLGLQNSGDGTDTCEVTKVSFEGFVYVGGDMNGSGGQNFVGCVHVEGSMAALTGNVSVYYNEDAAALVETTEYRISRSSWREIIPSW
jgi:hypothetical protein